MFRYILIRNFQSIVEILINDLDSGVVVFKGENEIGKGSIRKAIEALFTDIAAIHMKHFLRHGAHSIYIEAGLTTGEVVKRSFGEEKYFYMFRDEKLVTDDPNKIRENFNLYYDEQSDQLLNIRNPEDPLVGVYTSPMQNFKIIQKALGTQVLSDNVTQAKKDMELLAKRSKELVVDIADADAELRKLPEIKIDTETAERELEAEFELLEQMEEALELIQALDNAEIHDLPILDLQEMEQELQIIEKIGQLIDLETELAPKEAQAASLKATLDTVEILLNDLNSAISDIEAMDNLRSDYETLQSLEAQEVKLTAKVDDLRELVAEAELLLEIDQHICTFKDIRAMSTRYTQVHSEFKQVTAKREQMMRTNKFCPVVAETNSCPFSVDVSQLMRAL
jgi:hypothetical protein